MATTQGVGVEQETNRIHVSEFELHDEEVADFLAEFPEEDREQALKQALRVGVTTLDLAETSQDVEFVERKFAEMHREFEDHIEEVKEEVEEKFGENGHVSEVLQEHLGDDGTLRSHIEDAFGEDGPFQERLENELGEDGEKIQSALDPDIEGTPTYRLKSALESEIQSLRDELMREEGFEEGKQKSGLKGDDFEETVDNILSDIVYNTQHQVEYTGETEGEIPGREAGDFLVTLGETEQRIAIEAKTEHDYSQNDITDEMETVIENRDADYGIFVVDAVEKIPTKKVGWFQEFDGEMLVVAMGESEEDDIEPGFLRIAFNWARMRALQSYVETEGEIDTESIQEEIDGIEAAIDDFQNIKRKCTSIKNTADDIRNTLEGVEADVLERLSRVTAEFSKQSEA